MIGQLPEMFKTKAPLSGHMDTGRVRERRADRKRLDSLFSRLLAATGHGLRHVDRIGGGKAVLETLLQRALELAFTRLLAVALGFLLLELILHDALFRNCHACSPCKRRAQALLRTNNALAGTGVPRPVRWRTAP